MSDADRRELARATQRAPDDAAAWLALAQGAARIGSSDEALAAFYRSAALGGELVAIREGLRALGAPATPWGHPFGDSRRSRCSPLVGPRRGEIVARAPLRSGDDVVIAEDGTIHVGQPGGTIARFEGRTLQPLAPIEVDGTWTRAALAAGAGLVVATTHGRDSGLYCIENGESRCIALAGDGDELRSPTIHGDRLALVRTMGEHCVVHVGALSSPLEAVEPINAGVGASDLAADQVRIVFTDQSGPHYGSLNAISWDGRPIFHVELFEGSVPVLDALGRTLAVSDRSCRVFDERGECLFAEVLSPRCERVQVCAPTRDGGFYFLTGYDLTRVTADWRVGWTEDDWERGSSAVVDREGVFYGTIHDRPVTYRALAATAPDKSTIFEIEQPTLRPAAIDAFGRLLAIHYDEIPAKGELVAIA